jgi:hypothetical protein
MPISYQIETENQLVRCAATGTVTIAEVQAHQARLHADPAFTFQATASILWEFGASARFDHSIAQAVPLAESWLISPQVRRALVSEPHTEVRKFLSLWVLHRATRRDAQVRTFDDATQARQWLGQPR